ncbi:Inhibitor of growth protein 3 [Frankliniella fusca]|uniref:Inhibitor of growth protein 3 n=1 Tax=Frankliniella fusca TaxID=407009 RepID=A0AAE1LMP2_9NEOP|nr:Inhibitor of growth protein 3 [Frankliniella fusca]
MLYLEDYLEMIEHLPQELRDRFTDMREMDLGVQNSIDGLEKKVKAFFANAKRLPKQERDAEHDCIRKEYYKTLEDADEKVQLASQMYELVDRYLRRLDSELFKFKIELEADNAGITEILEKRSLELDAPPPSSREKENRYNYSSRPSNSGKQKKRRDSNAVGGVGSGSTDSRSSSHSGSLSHGHRDHHGGHLHRDTHHSGHRDGHRDGHSSHRDGHGSHRDGHGGHRDSHGGHRDGHGSHRDGHGGHRDGHGGHRDSHGGHRDGHGSHRDGHSSHRDSHRDGHRDGHRDSHRDGHRDGHVTGYRDSHVLSYALAPGMLKDRDRDRDRDRERERERDRDRDRDRDRIFGQSHHQLQAGLGLGHGLEGVGGGVAGGGGRHGSGAAGSQAQLQQRGDVSPSVSTSTSSSASGVPYGLGHMGTHIGAGGNAIAAAASQAIAATQQMQQGRRTASLKASYEAIGGVHSHDFAIGREIAGAAQTALAAIHDIPKKKKKSSASSSGHTLSSTSSSLGSSLANPQVSASSALVDTSPLADAAEEGPLDPNGDGLGDGDNPDWTYDPNEPRYCLCNQVSYGDMVACDNEDCPFEWFHYACVNITAPPKGKWDCPTGEKVEMPPKKKKKKKKKGTSHKPFMETLASDSGLSDLSESRAALVSSDSSRVESNQPETALVIASVPATPTEKSDPFAFTMEEDSLPMPPTMVHPHPKTFSEGPAFGASPKETTSEKSNPITSTKKDVVPKAKSLVKAGSIVTNSVKVIGKACIPDKPKATSGEVGASGCGPTKSGPKISVPIKAAYKSSIVNKSVPKPGISKAGIKIAAPIQGGSKEAKAGCKTTSVNKAVSIKAVSKTSCFGKAAFMAPTWQQKKVGSPVSQAKASGSSQGKASVAASSVSKVTFGANPTKKVPSLASIHAKLGPKVPVSSGFVSPAVKKVSPSKKVSSSKASKSKTVKPLSKKDGRPTVEEMEANVVAALAQMGHF